MAEVKTMKPHDEQILRHEDVSSHETFLNNPLPLLSIGRHYFL